MNSMMLSCVKATELMEMKEHVPLSFIKNMQLYMHTAMCSGCRNYRKQTKLIDELLRRTFETAPVVADTNELEAAIISKLQ
jgi:predicted anti-sigma-YlaC factor YlaD